LICAYHSFS